jgi:hypothetical protein
MQLHGTKRSPEEFKQIRKEWKARKKEADNNPVWAAAGSDHAKLASSHVSDYQQRPGRSVQLPRIGDLIGARVSEQY